MQLHCSFWAMFADYF